MPVPEHNRGPRGFYGPTDSVDPKRLIPGVTVRRYTETIPGGRLDVIAPCCGRMARLDGDWMHDAHLVLCAACARTYDVQILDENDGGFGAEFVVRDERPVLVRRRGVVSWLAGQHPAG
ncbi:hypothetical protein [Amycolatopsis sp. TNS106]|uniref:hypothetical protein n=1 Tax=Amycolatopsis sp. TNS106 TaxID=2861750 RepID=UPI001C594F07|nr:hypothetical protein [Amycolatopsis sp. TNS106]QXV57401.1 hypothetical protein CVV72_10615 [Amycolatopsis sp. TNS106]